MRSWTAELELLPESELLKPISEPELELECDLESELDAMLELLEPDIE